MKDIVWRWEYGVYVPFCPYCNEPAYEQDSCVFCGKPYQWVAGEIQPTEVTRGEYTVVQATNNHVALYKNGRRIMHIPCQKKMNEEELLEQIDFYEKLFGLEGEIISLEPGGGYFLNPLDVCQNDIEDDPIASNVDLIVALCKALNGPDCLSDSQVSLLESCMKRLYEPYINSQDEQTGLCDQSKLPTMRDIYNLVRVQCGFDAYALAMTLKEVIPDLPSKEDVNKQK